MGPDVYGTGRAGARPGQQTTGTRTLRTYKINYWVPRPCACAAGSSFWNEEGWSLHRILAGGLGEGLLCGEDEGDDETIEAEHLGEDEGQDHAHE